jgi:hypothetical protein
VLANIYRWWAVLLTVAVVVQIGAAGYGAFYAADKSDPTPLSKDQFDHGFAFHDGFGYFVFLGAVILFLLALATHRGRRGVLFALAAPVLVAIQIALALGGEGQAVVGIFHAINAFLILGLVGSIAGRAWRGVAPATA